MGTVFHRLYYSFKYTLDLAYQTGFLKPFCPIQRTFTVAFLVSDLMKTVIAFIVWLVVRLVFLVGWFGFWFVLVYFSLGGVNYQLSCIPYIYCYDS